MGPHMMEDSTQVNPVKKGGQLGSRYIIYIYIYLGSRNPLKIKCLERNLGSYRILKKTSGAVPKPRVCFLEPVLNPYLTHILPVLSY